MRTKEQIEDSIRTKKKPCIKCNIIKDHSQFSVNSSMADKVASVCRDCRSKIRSKRRTNQRSPQEILKDKRDGSKVCSSCGIRKPIDNYSICKGSPDSRGSVCRDCMPSVRRRYNIVSYGITLKEYDKMMKDQGGKCAICKSDDKLYVDHNHKTGEVRGLLCTSCNSGLGQLQDSPRNLRSAIDYLERRGSYGFE